MQKCALLNHFSCTLYWLDDYGNNISLFSLFPDWTMNTIPSPHPRIQCTHNSFSIEVYSQMHTQKIENKTVALFGDAFHSFFFSRFFHDTLNQRTQSRIATAKDSYCFATIKNYPVRIITLNVQFIENCFKKIYCHSFILELFCSIALSLSLSAEYLYLWNFLPFFSAFDSFKALAYTRRERYTPIKIPIDMQCVLALSDLLRNKLHSLCANSMSIPANWTFQHCSLYFDFLFAAFRFNRMPNLWNVAIHFDCPFFTSSFFCCFVLRHFFHAGKREHTQNTEKKTIWKFDINSGWMRMFMNTSVKYCEIFGAKESTSKRNPNNAHTHTEFLWHFVCIAVEQRQFILHSHFVVVFISILRRVSLGAFFLSSLSLSNCYTIIRRCVAKGNHVKWIRMQAMGGQNTTKTNFKSIFQFGARWQLRNNTNWLGENVCCFFAHFHTWNSFLLLLIFVWNGMKSRQNMIVSPFVFDISMMGR